MPRLVLKIDVEVNLNGVSQKEILDNLLNSAQHLVENGMITMSTDAEVEDYSISVRNLPEAANMPVVEEAVVEHIQGRIESGDRTFSDIAGSLARYGIMDPSDFVDEMSERMGQDLLDLQGEEPARPVVPRM